MRLFLPLLLFTTACGSGESKDKQGAPSVTISSHKNGANIDRGYAPILKGSAKDAKFGATDLKAKWMGGSKELCPAKPLDKDGTTKCDAFIDLDHSEITLQVTNPDGVTGEAKVSLNVSP